ncbi:MAG: hypothetical protein GF405_11200 [Candidatus Eisenbacteria bacterium]|nr:hypothetical protein [Candidatus Eisenbacteria bacterium]
MRRVLLALTVGLFVSPGCSHATSLLSAEFVLTAQVSEASGFTGEATGAQRNALGLEWFGTAGGSRGDVLRFDIQARVSHDAGGPGDAGPGLELHNAWLEYRPSIGRSFRLGHFSPAFGLEPDVDTHGTLLQTQAGPDVGFKKDWGAAWTGIAGPGDLTLALQTGSGAALDRRDRSYLATARMTFPTGPNATLGIATLVGRTLVAPDARTFPPPDVERDAVERARGGIDLVREEGNTRVLAELSAGTDDGEPQASVLARLERSPLRLPRLRLAVQARFGRDRTRAASVVALAADYRLTDRWTASASLSREAGTGGDDDLTLQLLLYYFGRVR